MAFFSFQFTFSPSIELNLDPKIQRSNFVRKKSKILQETPSWWWTFYLELKSENSHFHNFSMSVANAKMLKMDISFEWNHQNWSIFNMTNKNKLNNWIYYFLNLNMQLILSRCIFFFQESISCFENKQSRRQ